MLIKWPPGGDELSIFRFVKDLKIYDQELKFHKGANWELQQRCEEEKESINLLKSFGLKNKNASKSTT